MLSAETVAAGTALAIAECLRAGVTTALDMYFFPEAAVAIAADAGLDLRTGPVFVEFPGPTAAGSTSAWTGPPRCSSPSPPDRRWVCPHSTYLLSAEQLAAVGALAAELGARVHVHACETAAELAVVRERHGRDPIEVLRDTGLLGPGTVLAHGVHLTDDDVALVAAAGPPSPLPGVEPEAGQRVRPRPRPLAAGIPVALGTDGAASANDLDLWVAMRLAAYPHAARAGPASCRRRRAGDGDDRRRERRRRPGDRVDRGRHPRRLRRARRLLAVADPVYDPCPQPSTPRRVPTFDGSSRTAASSSTTGS